MITFLCMSTSQFICSLFLSELLATVVEGFQCILRRNWLFCFVFLNILAGVKCSDVSLCTIIFFKVVYAYPWHILGIVTKIGVRECSRFLAQPQLDRFSYVFNYIWEATAQKHRNRHSHKTSFAKRHLKNSNLEYSTVIWNNDFGLRCCSGIF